MKNRRQKRKILLATSEVVPFVKTGGLADVCGALPKILKKIGHDVRIVLPRYWAINAQKYDLQLELAPLGVQMGNTFIECAVLKGWIEDVPVYFIDHEGFFGRAGIYDDGTDEHHDNAARFGFFSRACIELCRALEFQPDIIHCNDWPTALIPAYLKLWHHDDAFFADTASVFSIHNIGYQGIFPAEYYDFLGLGAEHFTESKFESFGKIHFMKGALFYADAVSTVSPSYAEEITNPIGSNGLAPYIARRREDLYGILNGVDYEHWDPDFDPYIPKQYSVHNLSGKALCKKTLQLIFKLDVSQDIPVIAILSRLVHQKGLDLLMPIIESLVQKMLVQFVIVGQGEKRLEDFFGGLPARYPGKIGAYIGYTEQKAHVVEAGADFLLMPSLYEPCGLNQIYSLKYGTIPIVRETGGLKDTVRKYDQRSGEGTGFSFDAPTPQALYDTVGWAVSTYYDRPQHITQMRECGMHEHFTWIDSALEYEKMYSRARARRLQWVS